MGLLAGACRQRATCTRSLLTRLPRRVALRGPTVVDPSLSRNGKDRDPRMAECSSSILSLVPPPRELRPALRPLTVTAITARSSYNSVLLSSRLALCDLVDAIGQASAVAQGLPSPRDFGVASRRLPGSNVLCRRQRAVCSRVHKGVCTLALDCAEGADAIVCRSAAVSCCCAWGRPA